MASTTVNLLCGAMLCSALVTGSASGELQESPDSDEKLRERAEEIFNQLSEKYRALDSYSDRATITFDVKVGEDAADHFGRAMMEEQEIRLSYATPNRIAIRSESMELYCDGSTVQLAMPMFGEYVERDAPSSLADVLLQDDRMQFLQQMFGHPVLHSLIRDDERAEEMRSRLVSVTAVEEIERDGALFIRIAGTSEQESYRMMYDEPFSFEVLIDAETGLLHESRIDMTAFYNHMMQQMADMHWDDDDEDEEIQDAIDSYEKFEMIVKLRDVTTNEEIPEQRFVFADAEDLDKVDEFSFMRGQIGSQAVLIGDPAPAFTAATLEGEELSLNDLQGKVVLLDFWALWCGPCVQALPHVQKIADHFDSESVVVLGVNRDPYDSEERINRLLEKREISFGHVLDPEGEVASLYHVTGIPSMILIDAEGVVQEVGVGFHPGKVDETIANIEKLLAGEKLYTEEEIAEMKAEAEELGDSGSVVSWFGNRKAQRELEEQIEEAFGESPNTLESMMLPRGIASSAWQLQLLDVHGDGVKHAVVPHQQKLRVINLSTGGMEEIELSGAPRRSSVHIFRLQNISGKQHWLVGFMRSTMSGQHYSSFGVFTKEGENRWLYTPDLPRSLMAHFGTTVTADMTGDGNEEVIVALQITRMESSRSAMNMPATSTQILIFDSDGHLVARTKAGGYVHALEVAEGRAEDGRKSIICTSDTALWLQIKEGDAELTAAP